MQDVVAVMACLVAVFAAMAILKTRVVHRRFKIYEHGGPVDLYVGPVDLYVGKVNSVAWCPGGKRSEMVLSRVDWQQSSNAIMKVDATFVSRMSEITVAG